MYHTIKLKHNHFYFRHYAVPDHNQYTPYARLLQIIFLAAKSLLGRLCCRKTYVDEWEMKHSNTAKCLSLWNVIWFPFKHFYKTADQTV
jgi:hypothetical protein